MLSHYKKGFTLVELMIIIAIIGLLASTLYTSAAGYIAKANDSALRATLRQFQLSMNNYMTESNTIYDPSFMGGSWYSLEEIKNGTTPSRNGQDIRTNVSKILEKAKTFTHSSWGGQQISGFYAESNFSSPTFFWLLVVKSPKGDFLCMDSLPVSANKIYISRNPITSGGLATNGCVYWENN